MSTPESELQNVLSIATELTAPRSVQVNIAGESGEMGILAQHVPSIEQLKPGLVEIIEESGGNKQFFRTLQDLGRSLHGRI